MRPNANAREFTIRGQVCQFMPLEEFQEIYGLEKDFAVSLFQLKDTQGLGSINGAGASFHQVYDKLIAAMPRIPWL
jgi:hypothetical protein